MSTQVFCVAQRKSGRGGGEREARMLRIYGSLKVPMEMHSNFRNWRFSGVDNVIFFMNDKQCPGISDRPW